MKVMESFRFQELPDQTWELSAVYALPVSAEAAYDTAFSSEKWLAWFPANVAPSPEQWSEGNTLSFSFEQDASIDGGTGEVRRLSRPHAAEFTWGSDVIRLEFFEDDDAASAPQSRLRFSATVDEQGRGAREGAGWHSCIAGLREACGADVSAEEKDWKFLFGHYQELFGPDASTVLPPKS